MNNQDEKKKSSDQGVARAEEPEFRFAAVGPAQSETIDRSEYNRPKFEAMQRSEPSTSALISEWAPSELKIVPAFYPLEKSSRIVEDEEASEIASRLAMCFKFLSIQAEYDNDNATAKLYTGENVEMYLSLWKTAADHTTQGIVVELQRRAGDSIAFHRYSGTILNAAMGLIEDGQYPTEIDEDPIYSRRVQRLISMELKNQHVKEHENAIIAIEIAHSLITKDRMDARLLGLESLCLLTDPRKTGIITALLASHVVLLGTTQGVQIPDVESDKTAEIIMDETPFQEIRENILKLVQFSKIGDDMDHDEEDDEGDAEHMTLLHNLALGVLANALDVIENTDRFDDEPEDTKPSARARLQSDSSTDVANKFMEDSVQVTKREILDTLIKELGKASKKPHDATLSAKCMKSLCRASDEAKKKLKEYGAKQIVTTALDIGQKTHYKLETECKQLDAELKAPIPE